MILVYVIFHYLAGYVTFRKVEQINTSCHVNINSETWKIQGGWEIRDWRLSG